MAKVIYGDALILPPWRFSGGLGSADRRPSATGPRPTTSPMLGRSPRQSPSSGSRAQCLNRTHTHTQTICMR